MAATYEVMGKKEGSKGHKKIRLFVKESDTVTTTLNIRHGGNDAIYIMVDSQQIDGLPANVKTELLSCFDADLKDLIETDDYNSESSVT